MESKVSVRFYLFASKKNTRNLIPIYMRVRSNYKSFSKSTGLSVKQAEWDQKGMRVRGNNEQSDSINAQLDALKYKVMQTVTELTMSGKPFDVEVVKKRLEGKEQRQITLMKVYNEHLRVMRKLEGKEYAKPTIIKYTNTRDRLSQYLKYKFKRSDVFLHELNFDFMQGFEYFLRDRFDNSTTTCYKHYQRLTRILNLAIQKGYLDRYPFPGYKIRMPKKKIEYLEQEELDRIENTDFNVERLNVIRDIFIFCSYTGLAYAECALVSPDDVVTGVDGEKWISIVRQKTKKAYQVPVLPKAMDIIQKYSSHPRCLQNNKLLPVPSNVKYNAYLKEIAQIAGIKKTLVSHLARKTFATTVMLSNGCNIGVLSRLLGHANVQVTLDAYGAYTDQLVVSQVGLIRKKLKPK